MALLLAALSAPTGFALTQGTCELSQDEHPLTLLAEAVRLLEPSLPVLLNPSRLALPPEHPAF